jgi:hypothetical protein
MSLTHKPLLRELFNEVFSNWDASNGTDFGGIFHLYHFFNSDVSARSVASATTCGECLPIAKLSIPTFWPGMSAMLQSCKQMFGSAEAFNSDVSAWNVANSTDFSDKFGGRGAFHSDISRWSMANATDLS